MADQLGVDAVRNGMAFERARVEYAAQRLASANVPLSAADVARLAASDAAADAFAQQLGVASGGKTSFKRVHEPTHPMADAEGYVRYLDIDPTREMSTLISATRAYEANVRAYNALAQMNGKALEIGGKK